MEISIPSSSVICFIWHREHKQSKDFQSAIHPFNLALKCFHSFMRKDGPNVQSCRTYQSTAMGLDFPHASQKGGLPFVPGVPTTEWRKDCVVLLFGFRFSLGLRMGVTHGVQEHGEKV